MTVGVCVRVCVCARACPARAVSHWPQHKKECGKPGSKQDRQATTPAEPKAAVQGAPLGGANDGEGGGVGGSGVGERSSGEAARACSACGVSGKELKECADCHSTWYHAHAHAFAPCVRGCHRAARTTHTTNTSMHANPRARSVPALSLRAGTVAETASGLTGRAGTNESAMT